ncbi:MAG: hypothetical protein ABSG43_00380 [Solirubrobacteraceae bacterium]|jgi:hypothetical protein
MFRRPAPVMDENDLRHSLIDDLGAMLVALNVIVETFGRLSTDGGISPKFARPVEPLKAASESIGDAISLVGSRWEE